MKYIAFDTETSGLDNSKHSILTAYFIVFNEKGETLGELNLKIKPDKGQSINIDPEAMKVNKIDFIKHCDEAVTETEAKSILYTFLNEINKNSNEKMVPIGHNIKFDIDFICSSLINRSNWNRFVSYHVLDTATIFEFLKMCGLVEPVSSMKLGELAKAFNIETYEGQLHEAKTDVEICIKILYKCRRIVKNANK